ncbi:MAG: TlpA family protein disulfide reductase [Rhodospirillales bacterium]|nr:TlpA family protein disulfide reductase [Rhodospirillales bacterium]
MKPAIIINIFILVCVVALGYFATLYFDRQSPPVQTAPKSVSETLDNGQTVPAFSFTDTNGQTRTIQNFTGKTIILNFWASWCAPCIKEMPSLIKAAQADPDNIVFIGLSSDLEEETMLRFINKLADSQTKPSGNTIVFALDTENITQNLFQTFRLPETILIDQNQIMRTKFIGADWTDEELAAAIKNIQDTQQ